LLQALTDLHSRGFVHRDVKPENCFLHSDQVLLGDFGLVALCNNVVPAAATTALGWDTQRNMLENSCLRSAGFLRCQESGGSSNILTGSFCSSTISESSSSDSLVQLHQQQHQDRQPRNSDSSTVGVSSCISPRHEAAGTPAYAAPEVLMLAFNTPSKCSAVGPQVRAGLCRWSCRGHVACSPACQLVWAIS
jgi:serine/threonine protein kinase